MKRTLCTRHWKLKTFWNSQILSGSNQIITYFCKHKDDSIVLLWIQDFWKSSTHTFYFAFVFVRFSMGRKNKHGRRTRQILRTSTDNIICHHYHLYVYRIWFTCDDCNSNDNYSDKTRFGKLLRPLILDQFWIVFKTNENILFQTFPICRTPQKRIVSRFLDR